MKHLYGLITLLTLFTGIAALTLGALSLVRSKERHLKYFLVILAAFNGKFIVDLLWSYTILNIAPFPALLFRIVLSLSCVFDFVYFFFFIVLWNSLFGLGFTRRQLAAFALGLAAIFALVLLGGTYDTAAMTYRPGWPAVFGNFGAVLVFLWIIFIGFSHYREGRAASHRFFLRVTLLCLCAGFLQMAASLLVRLARFPDLELRAPKSEEIGLPWLSMYFAVYMAAIIYFFLKQYLLPRHPGERSVRSAAAAASDLAAWAESAAESSLQAALDAFCPQYALSSREREILALVLEGSSNAEIAKKLFISTGTVKTHMHNVLRKTGTVTRTRLIRLFHGS